MGKRGRGQPRKVIQRGSTDWMAEAKCLGTGIDYFDLECGLYPALMLCAVCQVADECLEYAVSNRIVDGVWGGEWGDRLVELVETGGEALRRGGGVR